MVTTTTSARRGTSRLFASLLPPTWPSRAVLLETAVRVDMARAGDGSSDLLGAWALWRRSGELPADANVRDLLAALGLLLGGIASEMRYRPRRVLRQESEPC